MRLGKEGSQGKKHCPMRIGRQGKKHCPMRIGCQGKKHCPMRNVVKLGRIAAME